MMFILITLGKILGILLLFVVILLLLLGCFPVWIGIVLKYDRLFIRLRVFGISFQVYPWHQKYQPKHLKEKKKAQVKGGCDTEKGVNFAQAQEKITAQQAQQKQEKRSRFQLSALLSVLETASVFLKALLQKIKIRRVKLILPIAAEDAYTTAVLYGQAHATLGACFALLQNMVQLEVKKINIMADFTGQMKYQRSFSCEIGAAPFLLLFTVVRVFYELQQKEKANERRSFDE